jgi:hypothetical protein
MMRRIPTLLACLLLLGACVKDQQAARTRVSGVDKEPEKQQQPTPEKLPREQQPPPHEQDLPPVEAPPAQPK